MLCAKYHMQCSTLLLQHTVGKGKKKASDLSALPTQGQYVLNKEGGGAQAERSQRTSTWHFAALQLSSRQQLVAGVGFAESKTAQIWGVRQVWVSLFPGQAVAQASCFPHLPGMGE